MDVPMDTRESNTWVDDEQRNGHRATMDERHVLQLWIMERIVEHSSEDSTLYRKRPIRPLQQLWDGPAMKNEENHNDVEC